jgi:ferredoxin-NADP reductase
MIQMIDYQSAVLGRTEVAEGTMAFQFEKPNDFVFKAGQYIDLTLSGSQPGLSNGLTHTFSVRRRASAHDPHAKYSFQAGLINPADR